MDVIKASDESYEAMSQQVRMHCASRLGKLLQDLQPYVDGSFGDINAAHASVYISAVRELGRLYRVQEKPVVQQGEDMVPAAALFEAVAAAVAEAEVRTAEATAASTRAAVTAELQAAGVVQLADARMKVRLQVAAVVGV